MKRLFLTLFLLVSFNAYARTGVILQDETGAVTGTSGNPLMVTCLSGCGGDGTSVTIDGGASPTVDAFGELSGDNDFWAASRGSPLFYDGTAVVALIGALGSDTPSNGQVLKWNTGGTITWESDNNSAAITCADGGVVYSNGVDTPSCDATHLSYNDTTYVLTATGGFSSGSNASTAGYIQLYELSGNGSNYRKFEVADALTGDATITLDGTDATVINFGAVSGTMATLDSPTFTTFLKLPQGASPTVDAAGKIAIDTTSDQLKYYGAAERVIPYTQSKSFVIDTPTASSDYKLWRVPYAVTITGVHVLATAGTNVIGGLDEADGNGANAAAVDSDITGTAGSNVNDDGALSNASIDSGDYINWHTTSVSGAVTSVTISYDYVITST